eukprot:CAMPEP_0174721424 /NCGR_PEP_ID=MMETSP1094-20130205/36173_1 /TAXON_ID=156173 /ORGANISM="Chrysochromulina brevifilum, Strain UTEX LB 985" /LENGTH=116 /DNA_ID=CAMNT_0015922111 /DNA_START=371 /DNA_END=723 /DNA_ORIENTATION=-
MTDEPPPARKYSGTRSSHASKACMIGLTTAAGRALAVVHALAVGHALAVDRASVAAPAAAAAAASQSSPGGGRSSAVVALQCLLGVHHATLRDQAQALFSNELVHLVLDRKLSDLP